MLPAVDQDHRDPVAVGVRRARVGVDVELPPAGPDIGAHPLDHLARVVAQVAAHPGEQGDPDAGHLAPGGAVTGGTTTGGTVTGGAVGGDVVTGDMRGSRCGPLGALFAVGPGRPGGDLGHLIDDSPPPQQGYRPCEAAPTVAGNRAHGTVPGPHRQPTGYSQLLGDYGGVVVRPSSVPRPAPKYYAPPRQHTR
ncbi:hypothetical protein FRAHR75_230092 [Frankia sp. Hr75.2]|nr:hypothetical protein FRAHR75_230092 [Frankia sp. Hr75.2]